LDADLKRRLLDEYGVLPEYVEVEFERIGERKVGGVRIEGWHGC